MDYRLSETSSIKALRTLTTLEQVAALNSIAIYSLRDLAEYLPCRYAEILVGCIENGNIADLNLDEYLHADALEGLSEETWYTIATLPILNLNGMAEADEDVFRTAFGVETIEQLAVFAPFLEAKLIIRNRINDTFHEKPSAPEELLPRIIGSTHTQVRFSNYVKEEEHLLEDTSLEYYTEEDEPAPETEIIEAFYRARFKFHLGYLAGIKQKWINAGTHLGEIIHSLALAPGESRNIAFVEWQSTQTSSRTEDTTASETLTSEFHQNRALNEVVIATAQEHLVGSTSIDASTKTTGYGLTAGFGSGASGGGSASADLTSLVGFPLQAGGAGLASAAGSTGGSLVHSNSSTQGTLVSETSGERTVTGEVMQNIADSTVQNSSNVRSLMSTVVVDDTQSGKQSGQTRNVTNYNHSHALTIQYYEVLQKYNTKTFVDSLTPVLFLPFKPIGFTIELIQKYWTLLKYALEQLLPPAKLAVYDQVIKDFNPENGAFDYSGDVRVDRIKIVRTRSYSEGVRVELYEANPVVTLKVSGTDMDKCLDFTLAGASTYLDYEFLAEATRDQMSFGSNTSFELDENAVARIKSNFKSVLKDKLKWYLDEDSGKTDKVWEVELDDNDLGQGNNRANLQQMVSDNQYRLLNGSQTIDFTLDIEYELLDSADNAVSVTQTYSDTLSYSDLHDGYDEEVFNATDHINSQLMSVTDINPADQIAEIEAYFRTYKYGFTKFLLNYVEKEQIIDVIEHLGLSSDGADIPLTTLIDPNPLGIVENLLIFKLKNAATDAVSELGEKFSFKGSHKTGNGKAAAISGSGYKKAVMHRGKPAIRYTLETDNGDLLDQKTLSGNTSHRISFVVGKQSDADSKYPFSGKVTALRREGKNLKTTHSSIGGYASGPDGNSLNFSYETTQAQSDDAKLASLQTQKIASSFDIDIIFKSGQDESATAIVNDYIAALDEYEAELAEQPVKNTVFLPTPGVFAEAILGIANASEYINISRFYNWQDSPIPNSAPAIADLSLNENRTQEISSSVNPNIPVSVLNQIQPQQMPATSLGTALGAVQNGSMFNDMSKTESLVSTLSTLSTLANNTAQLAGTLSGDAAANALNAAVELGKQVAGMVNTAMGSNIASAPQTQTEKGAAKNALEAMPTTPSGTVSPKDNAVAGGLGTPVNPPAGGSTSSGGSGTGSAGSGSSGSGSSGGSSSGGSSGGSSAPSPSPSLTNSKVEVVLRAFIPTGAVKLDGGWIPDIIGDESNFFAGIGGDDRLTAALTSEFDYAATDYRAQARLTIDFNSAQLYSPQYPACADWGQSHLYLASDVQPISGAPLDWMYERLSGVAPESSGVKIVNSSNFDVQVTQPTTGRIKVIIKIDGNLPLITGSPAINLWLELTFMQTGNSIVFDGYIQHDGFPSYELYLNGVGRYQHDCIAQGQTPLSLGPEPTEAFGTHAFWGEFEQKLLGVV